MTKMPEGVAEELEALLKASKPIRDSESLHGETEYDVREHEMQKALFREAKQEFLETFANYDYKGDEGDAVLSGIASEDAKIEAIWMPGRIEVVGKHTDYARGKSLVCATSRGLAVVFSTAKSFSKPQAEADPEHPILRIASRHNGALELVAINLKSNVAIEGQGLGWTRYVSAVVEWLKLNGRLSYSDTSISAFIVSSLPEAAGLSSSSALICATSYILTYGKQDFDPPTVDQLGAMERMDFVGTKGGTQDHAAIMMSRPGHLLLLDYSDGTKCEKWVKMPKGLCFVVITSGVQACKTGNALERYNALAGASIGKKEIRALYETRVTVKQTCDAFEQSDLEKLRQGILTSQAHAEVILGTTIPETTWLVYKALELGAIAASVFGAGFGGAVYALVDIATAENFGESWLDSYRRHFHEQTKTSEFFVTLPRDGAHAKHLF